MMRHQRYAFIIVLAALVLGGCSLKKEKIEITTAAETTEPETEAPETEEETEETREGMVKSYLTGLWVDEAIGLSRPLAIMLSNEKGALPQSGIHGAEVVYEVPVEGGTNRFMAVYEDYLSLDKIGSVRSARTYYVWLAKEFEAIFVHYGQSTFAIPYLDSANCDNLNGVEGIGQTVFYRTSDRKAPHNAYASAEGILAGIAKKGYSLDYPDSYGGHFQFAGSEDGAVLTDAVDAWKVVPGYVINQPWFQYNQETGLYYRFQHGAAHADVEDGVQISCKNILITSFENTHYGGTEYLDITLTGKGMGKYITNGRAIDITWEKTSEWGITRYYDTDGNEIQLNPGKTWVCMVSSSRWDKIELYGEE